MSRSFTFIDDVTNLLIKLIQKPAAKDQKFDSKKPNSSSSWCPTNFKYCNDNSVSSLTFINMPRKGIRFKSYKRL